MGLHRCFCHLVSMQGQPQGKDDFRLLLRVCFYNLPPLPPQTAVDSVALFEETSWARELFVSFQGFKGRMERRIVVKLRILLGIFWDI